MPSILDAGDPDNIIVQTDDLGPQRAGNAREVAINYPSLAGALRTALVAAIEANGDEMRTMRRLQSLERQGIFASLPASARTRIQNRREAMRAQREPALQSVALTNPARAAAKLAELLAVGVPITQATRDAVAAAQPVIPTPVPTPEPADGL